MCEKLAHCVSVTQMFCCVMEKSLQRTSLCLSQCYRDAVCVDAAVVGLNEAVKLSHVMFTSHGENWG